MYIDFDVQRDLTRAQTCRHECVFMSSYCALPSSRRVNPSLSELSESPEDRFFFFFFFFCQFHLNISLVSLGVFSCPSPPKCDVVRRWCSRSRCRTFSNRFESDRELPPLYRGEAATLGPLEGHTHLKLLIYVHMIDAVFVRTKARTHTASYLQRHQVVRSRSWVDDTPIQMTLDNSTHWTAWWWKSNQCSASSNTTPTSLRACASWSPQFSFLFSF